MNMEVEASIAERLQKLRQWQLEQQERLLKQQRIQREFLSHEQDRFYKAFGLSTSHDFSNIESTDDTCIAPEVQINAKETTSGEAPMLQCDAENSDDTLEIIDEEESTNADPSYENCSEEQSDEQSDDSDRASTVVDRSGSSMRDPGVSSQGLGDSLIEGIEPLSLDNKCVSLDDVPLPSPRKDFQTLLEEKLKREPESTSSARTDARVKPKRPFLKKGQGLSRFKMPTDLRLSSAPPKRSNALSSDTRRVDKSKKSAAHKQAPAKTLSNVSVAKRRSNTKTVSLSGRKVPGKSAALDRTAHNVAAARSGHPPEANVSDCDSKAAREAEEVRIFELLEEKAENSSFCSTSSTVLAFLQQSTPFKVRGRLNEAGRDSGAAASESAALRQVAQAGSSKSSVRRQDEPRKRPHANVDSYWDTVTVDNLPEDTRNYFASVNRALQSGEAYTRRPENYDAVSNSDEESDAFAGNARNLTRDSEADASHHVRFSEYNEYRTIDLIDVSDTASSPPLRDYLERENWDDCSSDTSGSSKGQPFDREERNSPLQIVNSEKAVDGSRLSLQQDVARRDKRESYSRVMKTALVSEEEDILSYKDESPDEEACYDNERAPIIEGIVRTSDEDRSVLSSSSSSSLSDTRELSTRERNEYALRDEPEEITKKIAEVCLNLRETGHQQSEGRTSQAGTELLKSRLLELEKEIDIFRKESSALLQQRRKLQDEETSLRKQYAEREKSFEENKRRVQNQLEEEKRRVTRERAAMENRIRDAQEKAKQSKVERQRAQDLREQLDQLRDELNVKESRWNAAESRYKSELRVLRVEISKLKQEIADLQTVKRTNARNLRRTTGQAITRAINQINKRVVVAPARDPPSTKTRRDSPDTSPDTSVRDDEDEDGDKSGNKSIARAISANDDFGQTEHDVSVNKVKCKQIEIESQPGGDQKFLEGFLEKKRLLYKSLLKDATSDLVESPSSFYQKRDTASDFQPTATQMQNFNAKGNDRLPYSGSASEDFGRAAYAATDIERHTDRSREANRDSDDNDARMEKNERKDRAASPEKNLNSTSHPAPSQSQIGRASVDAVKQIQFSDGRIEYWYPNGNVKKVFPDQEVTKMIYYNGDVRETDRNRRVKYFYAATRTWHTTTPDGLQILEFPDGQVEKRMSDGTVEVLFPDGTVAQTFINGDKILTLPNGQREIHTKEHKKREYPDGTVKFVYADGTQETRYSSGRKRLKDKDGNLLIDSYDG